MQKEKQPPTPPTYEDLKNLNTDDLLDVDVNSLPKHLHAYVIGRFDELKQSDENLRAYYKLAYYCGLRRCEINHTELTLDLNKQDVLMVTETKGVKDWNRDVPIHKDLIKDWQLVKSAMYKLDRISRGCRDAFKRAGSYIPYQTTMHSLRHTFATNKALEGMPMIELAKLMGHEETSTTEKYANATRELIVILRNESNTDMIHA